MKPILLFILLSGCASVKYERTNADGSHETLIINSIFRSLQGLEAERDNFRLKLNKAQPEVTPEDIARALRLIKPL